MNNRIFFFIFLVHSLNVFSGPKETVVTGKIVDESNIPVEFALVRLEKTNLHVASKEDGSFSLLVPQGKYKIQVTSYGFNPFQKEIEIKKGMPFPNLRIVLKDKTKELNEVVVHEKTATRKINESAFNVSALDVRTLHNSAKNVSDAISKVSGVRLRESGGMGSDLSFSLNGFTGKHVKVFLDGVPMEGFGSSFQLNNMPVNMAERIEVYKGVVPVTFGADALGGVVNIVTRQGGRNYLDMSYSIGSFHTHKSYVNFSYTLSSGWSLQANMYQNYSKNDYPVYVHEINSGGVFEEEEKKVKRFHDTYHNEAIVLQAGIRKKPFAEKLLLGIVLGKNKADIQTGNNMDFVYGEKFSEGNTIMPTLNYSVRDLFLKNLSLSFNGNFNFGYTQNVDTASYRKYNWTGNWTPSHTKGERAYQLYKYRDNNGSFSWNANYALSKQHTFMLSNVLTTFYRQGEDLLATDNADNFPSINRQNIIGASYQYVPNRWWNTHVFAKRYRKHSESHQEVGSTATYRKASRSVEATGYGVATTLTPGEHFQLKLSYEKAYRLPTGKELFGNNDLEVGNDSIRPENSHNLNVNVGYTTRMRKKHTLVAEAGFTYRDVRDFIRRRVSESQGTATSANDGRVKNWGISADMRYHYANLLTVGGNITYQDIRNNDKYNGSKPNLVYKDRVPNTPYFFGNVDASLHFDGVGGKENKLSLGYTMQFLEEFYLRWSSYGSKDSKYVVPRQLSHDIHLTYSLKKGKYNVMLACNNLTNQRLYDNYSLQKPGRSLVAKFRYYLQFK